MHTRHAHSRGHRSQSAVIGFTRTGTTAAGRARNGSRSPCSMRATRLGTRRVNLPVLHQSGSILECSNERDPNAEGRVEGGHVTHPLRGMSRREGRAQLIPGSVTAVARFVLLLSLRGRRVRTGTAAVLQLRGAKAAEAQRPGHKPGTGFLLCEYLLLSCDVTSAPHGRYPRRCCSRLERYVVIAARVLRC